VACVTNTEYILRQVLQYQSKVSMQGECTRMVHRDSRTALAQDISYNADCMGACCSTHRHSAKLNFSLQPTLLQ